MGLQVCTGTWGIMPALEEQKPASRMKHFPRQSGMAGLRVSAGRSAVLVQAQSIVLNVPSTWRGSKQGPGCTCVCVAQGSQGPARPGQDSRPSQGGLRHGAPKRGLRVTRRNYTGQFKYSLCSSLPLRFSLYFQKQ